MFMSKTTASETLAKCALRAWLRSELGWCELTEALEQTGLSQERLEELGRGEERELLELRAK